MELTRPARREPTVRGTRWICFVYGHTFLLCTMEMQHPAQVLVFQGRDGLYCPTCVPPTFLSDSPISPMTVGTVVIPS